MYSYIGGVEGKGREREGRWRGRGIIVCCLNLIIFREGRKVLGVETFEKVYEYLTSVRQHDSSEVNEMLVMNELRRLTPNTRDCFIVDQLVFLEKQQNTDIF